MRDILAGGVLVQTGGAVPPTSKGLPRRTVNGEERRSGKRRRPSTVHDVRIQPGQLASPGVILSYASLSLH